MRYDEYIEFVKTSDTYRRIEEELKTKEFSSKFLYSLEDKEYLHKASSICKYPVYRCKHRWTVDNIRKLRGSSVEYKCKIIASRAKHLKETAVILSYINNVEPWNIRLFEIMVQEIWYQYQGKPAYELTKDECVKNGLNTDVKHFKFVTREHILAWAIQYSFEAFICHLSERNDILREHCTTRYKLTFDVEDLYEKTDEKLMMNKRYEIEKDTKLKVLDYLYKPYLNTKWIKKQYEDILNIDFDRNLWEEWKKLRKIRHKQLN
jgi:hypothetical protein